MLEKTDPWALSVEANDIEEEGNGLESTVVNKKKNYAKIIFKK